MLLRLVTKFAIAAVLISALTSATAEDSTILHSSSSVAWPVPPFATLGNVQCDEDGNMYFNISLHPSDSGFLKVAHDGSKYHFYKLPTSDRDTQYSFGNFNVTPSGDLRVLAYGDDGETYVFLFHPDSNDTSKTKLELPQHLHLESFSAFESGVLLVTGFFNKKADKEAQGKRYTALFEASGKLRAVVAGRSEHVDLSSSVKKLPEGGTTVGPDGFLYLLRPNEVVVVSESGTIVRRMPFTKPSPELIALRIDASGGLIDVELMKDNGVGKELKPKFLVLNASTGERTGLYYEPEPSLGSFLCFSRQEGFTFMAVDDGKVKALTAPLR